MGDERAATAAGFINVDETTTGELERQLQEAKQRLEKLRAARQRGSSNSSGGSAAIPRRDGDRTSAPLSDTQQQLWFVEQLAPGKSTYNIPVPVRLLGSLDIGALRAALDAVAGRHESLRTVFVSDADGVGSQVILPEQSVPCEFVDLSLLPEQERQVELQRRLDKDARTPFDLAQDLKIRVQLIRLGAEHHVLMAVLHHICADGWSAGVFMRDLATAYAAARDGVGAALPELPVQYADVAAWQQSRRDELEPHVRYWAETLADLPTLDMPTDRPRPPAPSYAGAKFVYRAPDGLVDKLRAFSKDKGVPLLAVLHAGLAATLSRYTGATDIVAGTTSPGRTRPELEPMIGFFVNLVVLRTDLSGDPTFDEITARATRTVLDAMDHQDTPFDKVVEAVAAKRDPSRNPLFQVGLDLLSGALLDFDFPGLTTEFLDIDIAAARFDIAINTYEEPDGLTLRIEYATDLFDHATIERFAGHLGRILDAGATQPKLRLSELSMIDAAERGALLALATGEQRAYRSGTLPELVGEVATRQPEAPAIVAGGEVVSYAELRDRAMALAHRLRELNVTPGATVGIAMERGIDAIVSILAVGSTGAAYVPLDLALPVQRLNRILAASGCVQLLTHTEHLDRLHLAHLRLSHTPDAGFGVICLDQERFAPLTQPTDPAFPVDPTSTAYIIYTSGSTGVPKGVPITHDMVAAYLDWMVKAQGFDHSARVLHASSLAFDASIAEIFNTLVSGGTVVVASRDEVVAPGALADLLHRQRVTHLFATPAVLRHITPDEYQHLRGVIIGGEVCPAGLATKWRDPRRRVFNVYGPTETTVACIAYDLSGWDGDSEPPIGRPMANRRTYLVDGSLNLVPIGVPGEILIGGAGIADGYLDSPELTRDRFIPDPFQPGGLAYRSGDLASWTADGQMRFHGRIDGQVKLRGLRIELGDIESVLELHPLVAQAAVTVHQAKTGPQLVAYLVSLAEISAADLRRHLALELPAYMLPATYVFLKEMPLSPTGKVDRLRLPAPDAASEETAYVAPQTPAEALVAEIFEEVLGRSQVSREADFFALGGHSLLVARSVSLLRQRGGTAISTQSFYNDPTVSAVARLLGDLEAQDREPVIKPASSVRPSMVPLDPSGSRRPLFCPHAVSGSPFSYGAMSRMLTDWPVFGFEAPGLDGETAPTADLGRLAALYVQEIRAKQPAGPYLIAGWSMGAFLSFEMARQLIEVHGEQMALVAMLDPDPPGPYEEPTELEVVRRFAHELASMAGVPEPHIDAGVMELDEQARLARIAEILIGAQLVPPDVPRSFIQRRFAVFRTNMLALYHYQPSEYPGHMIFIGAQDSQDTSSQWSQYARSIEIVRVPGGHYTMWSPENLPHVVKALASSMDDVTR